MMFAPLLFRVLCAVGVLSSVLHPGAALAQLFTEPDRNWRESEYSLPLPPDEASLREFYVSAASPNTFLVDESSLDVGEDYVVRYVMVVRTPGGAENVSFEGIRCATGQRRIYALGRPDGEWVAARRSEWEPISVNSYNMPHAALAGGYFCDGRVPPRSTAEALRVLRTGPIDRTLGR